MKTRLALVTGGSGFLGSAITQVLLDRGYACRVLDQIAPDASLGGLEFRQGDIRDPIAVARAAEGVDLILHAVALVPVAKDRKGFREVNVAGTANLLQAAAAEHVSKVVFVSSSAVFGVPPSNPVKEDTEPTPREEYGRSKLEAERLCFEYARTRDLTIVRPRTILGAGRLGIFQILFEWIAEGRKIPVLGDGSNRYQFVHVLDAAMACVLAGERAGSGLYHCGAQVFGTMREALDGLCTYAGTGSQTMAIPKGAARTIMQVTSTLGLSPLAPYHALMYGESFWFDIACTVKELGWIPRYSNDEMLRESYDWFTQHRGHWTKGQSYHRSSLPPRILNVLKRFL